MEWLWEAHPNTDATGAIVNGDLRYRGVYGVGAIVPGLDWTCLNLEKEVIFIKVTSDALSGYKHQQLNTLAHVYAEQYNWQIIFYKLEKGEVPCLE